MTAILGIDAAWTASHPSGVALLSGSGRKWRCVALAPSYEAFIKTAEGQAVDWASRTKGGCAEPSALLSAAQGMLDGESVQIVAVDMPLATVPIVHRREAENAVGKGFGKYGCAPHNPNKSRPGRIGEQLRRQFEAEGFSLSVKGKTTGPRQLLEVFPHPALLRLVKPDPYYRIPYKVGKTTRYWKGAPPETRFLNLLAELGKISTALKDAIDEIPLKLPYFTEIETFSSLKPYEDGLDALVCAWVGIKHAQGETKPYGDETAAIWIPV
ncbi:MAG TPA: DUF429 domain-containing protein [Terriglobia bacterium]|nr:DUF429 domain-containing protein [Terriglobia bacterium]